MVIGISRGHRQWLSRLIVDTRYFSVSSRCQQILLVSVFETLACQRSPSVPSVLSMRLLLSFFSFRSRASTGVPEVRVAPSNTQTADAGLSELYDRVLHRALNSCLIVWVASSNNKKHEVETHGYTSDDLESG